MLFFFYLFILLTGVNERAPHAAPWGREARPWLGLGSAVGPRPHGSRGRCHGNNTRKRKQRLSEPPPAPRVPPCRMRTARADLTAPPLPPRAAASATPQLSMIRAGRPAGRGPFLSERMRAAGRAEPSRGARRRRAGAVRAGLAQARRVPILRGAAGRAQPCSAAGTEPAGPAPPRAAARMDC